MATPALEQQEVSRIATANHVDYILSILELAPGGGAFHVHKDIVRRKSPMIAAWIDTRPDKNTFSFSATTELAVAVFILWMYDNSHPPTLHDIVRAWPEFTVKGPDGNPLPAGPEYDFKQFIARLQAYWLATRYLIHDLKDVLSEALFDYFRTTLMASSDKAKDAVAAIFANTDADDINLRSRMVAFSAANKEFLDTTAEGLAVRSLMEVYVPWTWATTLRGIIFRNLQQINRAPVNTAPAPGPGGPGPRPGQPQANQGLVYGPQTYNG